MLSIKPIKAFSDNYIWLISTNEGSIVVDPGEADQILKLMSSNEIDLKAIFITHHHYDHTNGIDEILLKKKVRVYGPKNNIESIDTKLIEGDKLNVIGIDFEIIEIPGHTLDHIAFVHKSSDSPFIFCGDTLFSGGCGRVFEGTFQQMHHSINKISKLPKNTQIYCGHEYTASNLKFACAVEPENEYISNTYDEVIQMNNDGIPSIPSSLEKEFKINPFLKCTNEKIKDKISDEFGNINSELEIFTALRKWKDNF